MDLPPVQQLCWHRPQGAANIRSYITHNMGSIKAGEDTLLIIVWHGNELCTNAESNNPDVNPFVYQLLAHIAELASGWFHRVVFCCHVSLERWQIPGPYTAKMASCVAFVRTLGIATWNMDSWARESRDFCVAGNPLHQLNTPTVCDLWSRTFESIATFALLYLIPKTWRTFMTEQGVIGERFPLTSGSAGPTHAAPSSPGFA